MMFASYIKPFQGHCKLNKPNFVMWHNQFGVAGHTKNFVTSRLVNILFFTESSRLHSRSCNTAKKNCTHHFLPQCVSHASGGASERNNGDGAVCTPDPCSSASRLQPLPRDVQKTSDKVTKRFPVSRTTPGTSPVKGQEPWSALIEFRQQQ